MKNLMLSVQYLLMILIVFSDSRIIAKYSMLDGLYQAVFLLVVKIMKEYIEIFNRSYKDARKLKQYIYSLSISERQKDDKWEQIVFFCIELNKCEWYKE